MSYGIIKNPAFNLVNFSIPQFREQIIASSAIIDTMNTDLSRFFARGGRLIIKSQSSDTSSNPNTVMAWYDRVVARSGQATVDRHVRFYILPNGNHNGGVQALPARTEEPQFIDLIRMSTDWVEKDVTPPDAPVLSFKQAVPPYTVAATRPMCRYPAYPRYVSGDAKLAASYRCTTE